MMSRSTARLASPMAVMARSTMGFDGGSGVALSHAPHAYS
jgi:hypothetical protein